MYTRRFYREWVREDGLLTFDVKVDESDLKILCDRDLKNEALRALRKIRRDLEAYIDRDPSFLTAFEPYSVAADAPPFAAAMARAAVAWSVGPMAAVAGAVSQAVGESLLEQCSAVIIENGGDVYVKSEKPVKFAL